jgi:hypothetical protein
MWIWLFFAAVLVTKPRKSDCDRAAASVLLRNHLAFVSQTDSGTSISFASYAYHGFHACSKQSIRLAGMGQVAREMLWAWGPMVAGAELKTIQQKYMSSNQDLVVSDPHLWPR